MPWWDRGGADPVGPATHHATLPGHAQRAGDVPATLPYPTEPEEHDAPRDAHAHCQPAPGMASME
eukprot:5658526-Alexandrium_andersonii.AAC.1